MKIAIPSESEAGLLATRSGHFGHAPFFTIVTIENDEITGVETVKNVDHDAVGCGGVIDYVLGLGLDGIIAAGMGQPPFMRFTQGGMNVYFETQSPLVGGAVNRLIAGEVPAMQLDDACRH